MKIYFKGKKQVFAEINGFTIKTDQQVENGGDGEFPEPFALFLASLGTCAGIYVRSFCVKRDIPTENIWLSQQDFFDEEKKITTRIDIDIHVPSDFPEKYDQAVAQAAGLCLVKRHLKSEVEMNVRVVRAQ